MIRGKLVIPSERSKADALRDIMSEMDFMFGTLPIVAFVDNEPGPIKRLEIAALEKLGLQGAVIK